MGENADIKQYDFHPPNESMTLFSTSASKAAIVTRLLEADWLTRASDLEKAEGGTSRDDDPMTVTGDALVGKRYDEPVTVRWDTRGRAPSLFLWRRRRYVVEEVLSGWVLEAYWWDPARRVDRLYWRVCSGGGVYDLYLDRLTKRWYLAAVVD